MFDNNGGGDQFEKNSVAFLFFSYSAILIIASNHQYSNFNCNFENFENFQMARMAQMPPCAEMLYFSNKLLFLFLGVNVHLGQAC